MRGEREGREGEGETIYVGKQSKYAYKYHRVANDSD